MQKEEKEIEFGENKKEIDKIEYDIYKLSEDHKELLFFQALEQLNSEDFVVVQIALNDLTNLIRIDSSFVEKFEIDNIEKIKELCAADNPRLSNFALISCLSIAKYAPSFIDAMIDLDFLSEFVKELPSIGACKCIETLAEMNERAFTLFCENNLPYQLFTLLQIMHEVQPIRKSILSALIVFTRMIDDLPDSAIQEITESVIELLFPEDKQALLYFIKTKKVLPLEMLISSNKLKILLQNFENEIYENLENTITELFKIIASCNNEMAQYLIEEGIMNYIMYFYKKESEYKHDLITLATYLCMHSVDHITHFINEDFIDIIKDSLQSSNIKIKIESTKFVLNLISVGCNEEMLYEYMEKTDFINNIVDLLQIDNDETILEMLKTFDDFWSFGQKNTSFRPTFLSQFIDLMVTDDVIDILEDLQINSDNPEITSNASNLLTSLHNFV